jgi:hypothetical protein
MVVYPLLCTYHSRAPPVYRDHPPGFSGFLGNFEAFNFDLVRILRIRDDISASKPG